jgi:hypothetical protein
MEYTRIIPYFPWGSVAIFQGYGIISAIPPMIASAAVIK